MRQLIANIARKFANRSLRIRLMTIMLINSVAIIICTLIGYSLYARTYNQLLYRSTASNLVNASYKMSETLKNIEQLSSIIISASSVQDSLTTLQQPADIITVSENRRFLNNALFDYTAYADSTGIAFIALDNPQFTCCTNWTALHKTSPELLEKAKEAGMEGEGAVTWSYTSPNSYMLLCRQVRQIRNMSLTNLGELTIGADINRIVEESTQSISRFQNQRIIFADEDDRLLYASPELSDEDARFFLSHAEESYRKITYQNHDFFQVCGTVPKYPYKYVFLISYDEISSTLHHSMVLIFLVFAIGVSLAFFLSHGLVRTITGQFDALIAKMDEFIRSELTPPDGEDRYSSEQNEVGALHRHFNQMTAHIRHLVQVNYVNDILKKDAQLEALKSQINPHFLYNTLETVNWRAKAAGDHDTSQIVESLGSLLRASLSTKNALVPLSYELELVRSYMTIQTIRFENRLDYQFTVDPDASEALIPLFTIQPLMENAIHYGLEEMLDTCHIYLTADIRDGLLVVRVKNEGSQFEDNLLERLRSHEISGHGFGIGLLNIEQRIQLLFGEQYGLSLSNEADFAVATITVPYQKEGNAC